MLVFFPQEKTLPNASVDDAPLVMFDETDLRRRRPFRPILQRHAECPVSVERVRKPYDRHHRRPIRTLVVP